MFALIAVAFSADPEVEDGVLVLTDENFDEVVSSHDMLLVEFYAPWCGHCKKLAPEYSEAAGVLAELETPLYVAKVDATEQKECGKKFEIQGFPTLKVFRGLDNVSDYEGGRTADDIVKYLIKKSGPAAKTLEAGDVDAFNGESDVTVVGYFTSAESDEYATFLKVADSVDLSFGVVVGAEAAKIVLSKAGEDDVVLDIELTNKTAVELFIGANRLSLLITFNQDTAKVLFGEDQPIKVQVLSFAETDKLDEVKPEILKAATALSGKALFVWIDETNDRVFEYFGLSKDDFPTYVLVTMDGAMKKFMPEDSDFSKIGAFVESYLSGDLKPNLKSDDIPESQDEAVYVLVGKAFNEVALDQTKDVLVEFYAPWCGHCKSLAPKYDELAEKFAGVDSVIIAKMDSTANEVDHPDVNVSGFPTLKFFPSNTDKVIDYEGDRETDAMYDFVVENAGTKIVFMDEDVKEEL